MSQKTKVTMRHIADRSGVSQSTVSLILSGSQSIKLAQATRDKVCRIAREMGYEQKKLAHATAIEKIALIFNGLINNDPFIEAIYSAQQAAWQHNKLLAIFDLKNEPAHSAALEEEISRGGYQGLIYASCPTTPLPALFVNLTLPVVLLNGYCPQRPDIPCILPADKVGAYKATRHLAQQGYKRIAILTAEHGPETFNERIYGYRQALINHDICPDDRYIQITGNSLKEACQKTLELLAFSPPPEAIFCSSDYIALGCYQAILSRGLRIPEDIAVIGYNNQSLSPELTPQLSSVDLSYREMGKMALSTLLKLTHRQPLLDKIMKVEGELIVRQSSVKPRPGL